VSVIESTIEGRYQVITRVASGGMGEVFRAHDAVLARDVAVKVLHPQLAGDRGFVERFRREARAAAILNHPSIVGVYDWGATDGTYFMVMEFVQGTNLRSLLTEYGRLEPAQVVEVTLQVLAALDHAHGQGIVHRDIKPENILIARDGLVKVADFGLARAYADSFVSQAEGTVTGTVQYLAPEQIQGEPADPRTDLYALGVVMFELLTGRTPFVGETSLSIAYQHLSGHVPAPSSVMPTLPEEMDQVVLQATEKDREQRPPSARSMRNEILHAGVAAPPAPRVAELAGQLPSSELVPDERAPTVTIPRSLSPRARRARRVRRVLAILALLQILTSGAWATWVYAIPHYTQVPDVVGLTAQEAEARIREAGLDVSTGPGRYSKRVPTGSIMGTVPAADARIRKGKSVLLIPSLGRRLVAVPDVTGKPQDEAAAILEDLGFAVEAKREFHDTVPQGIVIRQDPGADQQIQEGATVTILISRGPPPVRIPDVTGQPTNDARRTLEALGFHVEVTQDFSTDVPRGQVISTDPSSGRRAPKGSTVTLFVSKGPRTFSMPDVIGMQREAAIKKLEGLGLSVKVVEIPGTHGNQVVYQDPDPGVTVEQGQQVTIYVTQP
jgi:beta-lactam-binding protein with PASTA domain/predicted Ser/Thr protein kinase